MLFRICAVLCNFYPRPPRGGRPGFSWVCLLCKKFLSTPSARRATSDRPPERRASMISIHALREEGDTTSTSSKTAVAYFYPRPPRGGRPYRQHGRRSSGAISIHALREEGDLVLAPEEDGHEYFYPRPPRGGRHDGISFATINGEFLSTPSARRATAKTETKSLFSYKLYNILHEFRRALIYNGSKNYPNHAK